VRFVNDDDAIVGLMLVTDAAPMLLEAASV
jgi:hypothetical protein